jgi:phage head maturation protease
METILYREATFERKTVNVKARTVSVAFSSEEPVKRGSYQEVLGHDPGEYNFDRLNAGASVLLNHDVDSQVGVVESASVQRDGQRKVGRALLRFSKGQAADEIFNDIVDGIRKHVSVGYAQTKQLGRAKDSESDNIIRYAWEPYEISLVTIPADTSVGVGRAKTTTQEKIHMTELDDRTEIEGLAAAILKNSPHLQRDVSNLTTQALCENWSVDKFRSELWAVAQNKPAPEHPRIPAPRGSGRGHEIGMSQREIQGYSVLRALRSAFTNKGMIKNDCPEYDFHQQAETNSKTRAEGFWIPSDVIVGGSMRDYLSAPRPYLSRDNRDMTVGVYGAGGAFVETIIETPLIEILRNKIMCARLGMRIIAGLEGNVAFPREVAPSTPYSLGEIVTLTDSNPSVDQIPMQPHRVAATVKYSRMLLVQSSIDLEGFVRDDLMKQIAVKHDSLAILGGTLADEPVGILNQPGISSLTFGGAPTWAQIISFETALGALNADRGRMAYLTTPVTRGFWKQLGKALTGVTVVGSVPVWETLPGQPPTDEETLGLVNGYLSASSNNIPGNQVLFGNWQDVLFAMWGGFDTVVDPFTLATSGECRITINTMIDIALRHAQSFCLSTDAGNQ